jgi:hypothetical protein
MHVAVSACGQEMLQPLQRLRDRVRPRDPDRVEAVLARSFRQRRLERCRVAQKSRSA